MSDIKRFEVGKSYKAYARPDIFTVAKRTAKFVTFVGCNGRHKIRTCDDSYVNANTEWVALPIGIVGIDINACDEVEAHNEH